jgi:outer membrane protein OmpA-like peptidoglycan-associated protein
MEVSDIRGNEAIYDSRVPLDVLVLRRDGKMFLLVPNIIFGAYKHTLDSRGAGIYRRNVASIRRVADIFKRYPGYGVGLEAHALNIYRGGPREGAEEQILGPLTERRAATVRAALIELGVPADKITSNAYGGRFPLVDVHDLQIRWKNRRVEFMLTR